MSGASSAPNAQSSAAAAGNAALQGLKKGLPAALEDSDDHDDFNPIKDLMPPSISNEEIDMIGKKRPRDKDPLRSLLCDDVTSGGNVVEEP